MNVSNLVLLLFYIAITVGGATFMKLGDAYSFGHAGGKLFFSTSLVSLIGFALYLCSFLMWAKLLTKFSLSYAVPLTGGISNLALVLIGLLLFHEKISFVQWFGVFAIIIGIVLISLKNG